MLYFHGGALIKENPIYPKKTKWKHGCIILHADGKVEVIERD